MDRRRFLKASGPATQSRSFGLEASVAGIYRIALRSPAEAAKSFTLRVESSCLPKSECPQGQQEEPKQKYASPRIAALRKEVEAGNRDAVATFWRGMPSSLKDGAASWQWQFADSRLKQPCPLWGANLATIYESGGATYMAGKQFLSPWASLQIAMRSLESRIATVYHALPLREKLRRHSLLASRLTQLQEGSVRL
jgi:hypothetical protein